MALAFKVVDETWWNNIDRIIHKLDRSSVKYDKNNFCDAYEALQVECCKMFANLNIIFAIYFAKTIWQINQQQLDNVVILANLTFVHINHHIMFHLIEWWTSFWCFFLDKKYISESREKMSVKMSVVKI